MVPAFSVFKRKKNEMKHLIKLTTVLMLLFAGFGFAACSDDDGGSASEIVGSWKYTYDNGCYEIMTFNADGTGSNTEYYPPYPIHVAPFTYIFDAKNQTLTLYWDDLDEDENVEGPFGPVLVSGNKLYIEGDEYVRVE